MKIIAHRGYSSQAPENTMAAFERAVEAGFSAIELDVQLDKEGHVVVIHDEKVDRTSNGTGLVKDMTCAELQQLDFGTWFSKDFAGETIPKLSQVFDLAVKHNIWVNVELKNGIIRYPFLEEKVIDLIKEYKLLEQVSISSFNHYSLVKVKELWPALSTGILYSCGLYEPWNYAKTIGADALHPVHYNIVPEITEGAKAHGLKLNPWTVDELSRIEAMAKAGVDGIITNYPERVQAVIA